MAEQTTENIKKQFVIVTASEIDSLDVRVWFEEHVDYNAACFDNNVDPESGENLPEPCWKQDEHDAGTLEMPCADCPTDEDFREAREDHHRVTLVLEVPPMGKHESLSWTNG